MSLNYINVHTGQRRAMSPHTHEASVVTEQNETETSQQCFPTKQVGMSVQHNTVDNNKKKNNPVLDEVNSNLSCGTGSGNAHMADVTQEWERTSVFSIEGAKGKQLCGVSGKARSCN